MIMFHGNLPGCKELLVDNGLQLDQKTPSVSRFERWPLWNRENLIWFQPKTEAKSVLTSPTRKNKTPVISSLHHHFIYDFTETERVCSGVGSSSHWCIKSAWYSNPSEKYARQIGKSSPNRDEKKNIWIKVWLKPLTKGILHWQNDRSEKSEVRKIEAASGFGQASRLLELEMPRPLHILYIEWHRSLQPHQVSTSPQLLENS